MDGQGKLHLTKRLYDRATKVKNVRNIHIRQTLALYTIYIRLSLTQQLIDRGSTEGDRPREYRGAAFAVLRIPETPFRYLITPTSDQRNQLMIRYVLSSL